MSSAFINGKARITGVAGTFTVLSNMTTKTAKFANEWESDIIQDELGNDCSWRWRNGKLTGDVNFVLCGSTAALLAAGAVLANPGTSITLSGFAITGVDGAWQLLEGQSIDLSNTDTGTMAVKLRRYTDAAQNTAANTTAT